MGSNARAGSEGTDRLVFGKQRNSRHAADGVHALQCLGGRGCASLADEIGAEETGRRMAAASRRRRRDFRFPRAGLSMGRGAGLVHTEKRPRKHICRTTVRLGLAKCSLSGLSASLRQMWKWTRRILIREAIGRKFWSDEASQWDLDRDDLRGYSSEWVEPMARNDRDWTVVREPPTGQGIAALGNVDIMEKFPDGGLDLGRLRRGTR